MVSRPEIERRYASVREAMDAHGIDAVVVCGSEYTGFEGAVTYLSGFVIVHRYAYVLLPREGDPSIVFPAEARYVGEHGTSWIDDQVFAERPDLRVLVTRLVDEGKAVAAAQGIELDADPEELIDHAARPDVAYDHKASMLQDVEARRATEIDFLNGGIVRFGDEHGVPTPLNRAIWALVKGLERSW